MNDTENIMHNIPGAVGEDKQMLTDLQRETFDYFVKEVNPTTGLIADKTQPRRTIQRGGSWHGAKYIHNCC